MQARVTEYLGMGSLLYVACFKWNSPLPIAEMLLMRRFESSTIDLVGAENQPMYGIRRM
jgi:hypothetical protein